jgi:hypothetical protein
LAVLEVGEGGHLDGGDVEHGGPSLLLHGFEVERVDVVLILRVAEQAYQETGDVDGLQAQLENEVALGVEDTKLLTPPLALPAAALLNGLLFELGLAGGVFIGGGNGGGPTAGAIVLTLLEDDVGDHGLLQNHRVLAVFIVVLAAGRLVYPPP